MDSSNGEFLVISECHCVQGERLDSGARLAGSDESQEGKIRTKIQSLKRKLVNVMTQLRQMPRGESGQKRVDKLNKQISKLRHRIETLESELSGGQSPGSKTSDGARLTRGFDYLSKYDLGVFVSYVKRVLGIEHESRLVIAYGPNEKRLAELEFEVRGAVVVVKSNYFEDDLVLDVGKIIQVERNGERAVSDYAKREVRRALGRGKGLSQVGYMIADNVSGEVKLTEPVEFQLDLEWLRSAGDMSSDIAERVFKVLPLLKSENAIVRVINGELNDFVNAFELRKILEHMDFYVYGEGEAVPEKFVNARIVRFTTDGGAEAPKDREARDYRPIVLEAFQKTGDDLVGVYPLRGLMFYANLMVRAKYSIHDTTFGKLYRQNQRINPGSEMTKEEFLEGLMNDPFSQDMVIEPSDYKSGMEALRFYDLSASMAEQSV